MGTYQNCDHKDPCACFQEPIDLYGLTLHPNITRCMSPQSEVMVKPNDCGQCDTWYINWCQAFNNNVFGSSDGSILVSSTQTYYKNPDGSVATDSSGNPIGRCTLDFKDNQKFFINGKQVFCKGKSDPSERHMCLETVGLSHYWTEVCGECGDNSCETLVLDASAFALARAIDVGCSGSSLSSLTPVKNTNGTIKFLVDCNVFTIETDKSDAGLVDDDIIRLGMVKQPIFEINGVAPTSQGDFNVTGTEPIVVSPITNGVNVSLSYDESLKVEGGQLKVAPTFNIPVSGRAPVQSFTLGSLPQGEPTYVTSMNRKDFTVALTNVVPGFLNIATAPAPIPPSGYKYVLNATFHTNAFLSGPTYPADRRVQISLVPIVGGSPLSWAGNDVQQSDSTVTGPAASNTVGQQIRTDLTTSGFFNIGQGVTSTIQIRVEFHVSGDPTDFDTVNTQITELSYDGVLMLVPL